MGIEGEDCDMNLNNGVPGLRVSVLMLCREPTCDPVFVPEGWEKTEGLKVAD